MGKKIGAFSCQLKRLPITLRKMLDELKRLRFAQSGKSSLKLNPNFESNVMPGFIEDMTPNWLMSALKDRDEVVNNLE